MRQVQAAFFMIRVGVVLEFTWPLGFDSIGFNCVTCGGFNCVIGGKRVGRNQAIIDLSCKIIGM